MRRRCTGSRWAWADHLRSKGLDTRWERRVDRGMERASTSRLGSVGVGWKRWRSILVEEEEVMMAERSA